MELRSYILISIAPLIHLWNYYHPKELLFGYIFRAFVNFFYFFGLLLNRLFCSVKHFDNVRRRLFIKL